MAYKKKKYKGKSCWKGYRRGKGNSCIKMKKGRQDGQMLLRYKKSKKTKDDDKKKSKKRKKKKIKRIIRRK